MISSRGQPLLVVGPPRTCEPTVAADLERDVALDPDQLREPLAQRGVVGDLDEQRGRQLARVGDQLVVGLDLVRDLLRRCSMRSARAISWTWKRIVVGVLEHDRHEVAERDAAPLLERR